MTPILSRVHNLFVNFCEINLYLTSYKCMRHSKSISTGAATKAGADISAFCAVCAAGLLEGARFTLTHTRKSHIHTHAHTHTHTLTVVIFKDYFRWILK